MHAYREGVCWATQQARDSKLVSGSGNNDEGRHCSITYPCTSTRCYCCCCSRRPQLLLLLLLQVHVRDLCVTPCCSGCWQRPHLGQQRALLMVQVAVT
jgi:hypothetical protein